MPVQIVPNLRLKAAVTVAAMAKALNMSRSQFYAYVRRGIFAMPVYSLTTRRPFYTAEMQQEILTTRQTGLTPTGEYVLFYERTAPVTRTAPSNRPALRRDASADLVARLGELGITVSPDQVQQALTVCFPSGTAGQDEGAVLRTLNRHLRRSIAA